MVFTLMYGLFRTEVDNTEVFKLIGPAFQTIVGGIHRTTLRDEAGGV
jgi:hypothetical protein